MRREISKSAQSTTLDRNLNPNPTRRTLSRKNLTLFFNENLVDHITTRKLIEIFPDFHILSWIGTCYERVITFRLKRFPNDGAPYPKILGNRPFYFCMLVLVVDLGHGIFHPVAVLFFSRPWDFSSCSGFIFVQISFWVNNDMSQPPKVRGSIKKKKVVHLYRSTSR